MKAFKGCWLVVTIAACLLVLQGCGRKGLDGQWRGVYRDGRTQHRVAVVFIKDTDKATGETVYSGEFIILKGREVEDLQKFKSVTVADNEVEAWTDDRGLDGKKLVLTLKGDKLEGTVQDTMGGETTGSPNKITLNRE